MRISDWSSDVCSSDLLDHLGRGAWCRIDRQRAVAQRRHEGRMAFEHRKIALGPRHGDHMDVGGPLEAGGGDEVEVKGHVLHPPPPACGRISRVAWRERGGQYGEI